MAKPTPQNYTRPMTLEEQQYRNTQAREELEAEDYRGENFPYRGVIDHGVPAPEVTHTPEDDYHRAEPVQYEPLETEPTPIPVKVVESVDIKRHHISSHLETQQFTFAIGDTARRTLATPFYDMVVCVVSNVAGGTPVYVGGPTVNTSSGFLIPAGGALTLDLTTTLYIVSDGVAATTVYALMQHEHERD